MKLQKTLQVRLPLEVVHALQAHAKASGHTLSSLVRHILTQFAERSTDEEVKV